ncbi:MAG TPA: YceI family protein [Streptosporangiaceae bacterium]|nr:YceI family protein [Streptosporangiaceae bacterium]
MFSEAQTTGSVRIGANQVPGYIVGRWKIDPAHSHVGFSVKHMMVSKVRGKFASFEGSIITAAQPLESAVSVTIDADSVDTGNETRDEHVRSEDFLATAKYPTISFTSTGVRNDADQLYVDGDLTIRGVTRPVMLNVEIPQFVSLGEGSGKAGFSATTEINRSEFGVTFNGVIPGSGVTLGEKVQIILEVEAELLPDVTAEVD